MNFWLLVIAFTTPAGLQYKEHTAVNGVDYATYEDCIADGAAYIQELTDAGVTILDYKGGCYFVSE
jgi:hypothetical protein